MRESAEQRPDLTQTEGIVSWFLKTWRVGDGRRTWERREEDGNEGEEDVGVAHG